LYERHYAALKMLYYANRQAFKLLNARSPEGGSP
jgi:hypothetical protein